MKLLKVADSKYVNTDNIAYVEVKRRDKVMIQFNSGDTHCQPYLLLKGSDAEQFIRWLESNADHIGAG